MVLDIMYILCCSLKSDIFIREPKVNVFGRAGITNLHSPTKRVVKRHPTKGAL